MTRDGLIHYLKTKMGLDTDGVDDTTPLFSSGLLDSFSMVDMILFIEQQSGVRMAPMDVTLDNLDSIQRILDFATAKAAG